MSAVTATLCRCSSNTCQLPHLQGASNASEWPARGVRPWACCPALPEAVPEAAAGVLHPNSVPRGRSALPWLTWAPVPILSTSVTHTDTQTHTCTDMHTQTRKHVHTCTRVRTHAHRLMHKYTCTHTHAHTCTDLHTHMNTQIHARAQTCRHLNT